MCGLKTTKCKEKKMKKLKNIAQRICLVITMLLPGYGGVANASGCDSIPKDACCICSTHRSCYAQVEVPGSVKSYNDEGEAGKKVTIYGANSSSIVPMEFKVFRPSGTNPVPTDVKANDTKTISDQGTDLPSCRSIEVKVKEKDFYEGKVTKEPVAEIYGVRQAS